MLEKSWNKSVILTIKMLKIVTILVNLKNRTETRFSLKSEQRFMRSRKCFTEFIAKIGHSDLILTIKK